MHMAIQLHIKEKKNLLYICIPNIWHISCRYFTSLNCDTPMKLRPLTALPLVHVPIAESALEAPPFPFFMN